MIIILIIILLHILRPSDISIKGVCGINILDKPNHVLSDSGNVGIFGIRHTLPPVL